VSGRLVGLGVLRLTGERRQAARSGNRWAVKVRQALGNPGELIALTGAWARYA